MSKFIISTPKLSPEQENAITSLVQDKGWSIWHWFENLWLLTGVPDEMSSQMLFTILLGAAPIAGTAILVMKVTDPITSFGAAHPDSWKWIAENWGGFG